MSSRKKVLIFVCNGENFTIEVDENDTIAHMLNLFFDVSNSDNRLKDNNSLINFFRGTDIINKTENLQKKVSAFKFKQNAKIKVMDTNGTVGGFSKIKNSQIF